MTEHAYKLLKTNERLPMTKICFILSIENQIGYIGEANIYEKNANCFSYFASIKIKKILKERPQTNNPASQQALRNYLFGGRPQQTVDLSILPRISESMEYLL